MIYILLFTSTLSYLLLKILVVNLLLIVHFFLFLRFLEGYGREYRERLLGQWGVVDVNDCCSCATFLVLLVWTDKPFS
jgi:hypothetical protein